MLNNKDEEAKTEKKTNTRTSTVRFKRKTEIEQLIRGSTYSAGYDIAYTGKKTTIKPNEIKIFETGLEIQMPNTIEAQIRSRSGLATKGLFVLNSPGTIDPDYTGEIKVIMLNAGSEEITIETGQRIAQMIFARILNVKLVEGLQEKKTGRGRKGFGSTG